MTNIAVQEFLDKFGNWAQSESRILAVGLVGSYARNTATPTSDIDLIVIASEPEIYLRQNDWVQLFGTIARTQVEHYGKVTSLRVWYTSGLEVEYGLSDADWAALPLDEGTRGVISDGMRVVFERGPILSSALAEAALAPGASELDSSLN